jgi:hypothetical protein
MKVKLTNVRLAFANLFEAKSVNGEGDPRYSTACIIDPKSVNVKACRDAVKAVATEKWKDKAEAVLKKLKEEKRVAFQESPRANADGEVYQGFEGMFSLNAGNKARPLVIDRDKTPLTAADGKPYSGCYADVSVEFWAQDNAYGRRVNATLRGVQFRADGDSFGGGAPASSEDFEDLSAATDDESA